MLAGHASGCWLSALGACMPYNREKKQSLEFFYLWHISYLNSQPSSDSSLTKVVILQTTGLPQGTGFVPSNKELVDKSAPSNKELVDGTVPSSKPSFF